MATVSDKKDRRSPSFPFISLRQAVERAGQFHAAHRREAARLATVAPTWGYRPKSSGLLQTVAALKQYGLIDDSGSGEDRRIQLTELARRILSDTRPGAREQALKEAAVNPKFFAEYLSRWVPDFPDERHCVSELELDRGFTPDAAKNFVKVLKLTVKFAGLGAANGPTSNADESTSEQEIEEIASVPADNEAPSTTPETKRTVLEERMSLGSLQPLGQRLRVTLDGNRISVQADLVSASEIDKLIRILEANRALLDEGS